LQCFSAVDFLKAVFQSGIIFNLQLVTCELILNSDLILIMQLYNHTTNVEMI